MLANHEAIRLSLAERFKVILVDEFQDTDPIQCEIFQRIAGAPPAGVRTRT
ncbi:UvrD-helicase domain-containing protein [Chenggangzhangella methanolivorans]|uniref:UvrD-helicase domain-containing protein n=1 Tax=Chenggangzhangella methanolivorans TaxID=1437009 RepID=A0A9E6UIB3_9HYPH|nr:UvrD-helicase domain-containing protein [Chenggangzhangella methanolivorans]